MLSFTCNEINYIFIFSDHRIFTQPVNRTKTKPHRNELQYPEKENTSPQIITLIQ